MQKIKISVPLEADTIKRVEALAKKHDRKRADMLRVLVLKGIECFEKKVLI